MKIKYRIELDDIVAFNRYHIDHSAAMRRTKWLLMWGSGTAILASTSALAVLDNSIILFVLGVAGAILGVLLLQRLWTSSHEKQVRRLYSEGANKRILGVHELELGEDRLTERSDTGGQETVFSAVERIVTTDGHAFIYIASVIAHVIPRSKVIEGDIEAFVGAVQLNCPGAQTARQRSA